MLLYSYPNSLNCNKQSDRKLNTNVFYSCPLPFGGLFLFFFFSNFLFLHVGLGLSSQWAQFRNAFFSLSQSNSSIFSSKTNQKISSSIENTNRTGFYFQLNLHLRASGTLSGNYSEFTVRKKKQNKKTKKWLAYLISVTKNDSSQSELIQFEGLFCDWFYYDCEEKFFATWVKHVSKLKSNLLGGQSLMRCCSFS